MNKMFQRTELLIGKDKINILKNRRVAVFGVGGVGGSATEALCRSAIGTIDVFDGDIIDVTNLNRQIIATVNTIGQNKVDVIKKRLLEINPEITVNAHKLFYLPETADNVDLSVYDYVIDAVDTMTAKLELVCRCKALSIPVISSMGTANKLDPTAFEISDVFKTSVCPMARIMRKELRDRNINNLKVVYSKEQPAEQSEKNYQTKSPETNHPDSHTATNSPATHAPNTRPVPSSISFVPPVAGLILAGEVIKDLIGHT